MRPAPLILGAGPAGVVLAKVLQDYGHTPLLIGRPRRQPALEGLSERGLAGLRYGGFEQTLATIDISAFRQAVWNGATDDANREWLIDRQRFDAALLDDARRFGLTPLTRPARSLRRDDGGGWQLRLADGSARRAGFVIDARGRATAAGLRGPRTTALSRRWRLPRGRPRTALAAFAGGWLWFADTGEGFGLVQVFVDSRLPPRPQLIGYYQRLVAGVVDARDWLRGGESFGEVYARPAEPRCSAEPIGPDHARVGDAAFAPDPLSGHGLYHAIGSALALAAVLNTCWREPQRGELARRFYRDKIDADFHRMARVGRDFYALERRWPRHPFWRQRRLWPDRRPAHADAAERPARVERRPVNDGGLIREREVIVTTDHPRGVWRLAGVPLCELLRRYRTASEVGRRPAVLAAALQVTPRACESALAWLRTRRLL